MNVVVGEDGLQRCHWCMATPAYRAYHDRDWGRPHTGDNPLFEVLSQEAFQAGLSWLTILNKRERYRPPLTLPMGRSECAESKQLSKDLKARGWRFVGSTTVYSFMQAAGLVNDHAAECHARAGSGSPSGR